MIRYLFFLVFMSLSFFATAQTGQNIQANRVRVDYSLRPPLDTISNPYYYGEIRSRLQDQRLYMGVALTGQRWVVVGDGGGGGGADSSVFSTLARLYKIADSLGALIGAGGVTEVAPGWGITALPDPITTTGFIGADSGLVTSRAWHQKGLDSLGALIGGPGSYTFDYGLSESGGTVKVDTADISTKAYVYQQIDLVTVDAGYEWELLDREMGANYITQNYPLQLANSGSIRSLADGAVNYFVFIIKEPVTMTGIKYYLSTQGDYTEDNTNGVALYKLDGDTIRLVAQTANNSALFESGGNTVVSAAFTSTYSADKGVYYAAFLHNSSAVVQNPGILSKPNLPTGIPTFSGKAYAYIKNAQTTFVNKYGTNELVSHGAVAWVAPY